MSESAPQLRPTAQSPTLINVRELPAMTVWFDDPAHCCRAEDRLERALLA
jgi:hypothetical protein